MRMRSGWAAALCLVLLAGCARPPSDAPLLSSYASPQQSDAARQVHAVAATVPVAVAPSPVAGAPATLSTLLFPRTSGQLAGRTIIVDSQSDIVLRPGEVVLTFDDGPRPGRTDTILDTLDRFGVQAVFLMLGEMVQANPELARRVARAGHTIGSHTFSHANLSLLPPVQARDQILRGHAAVAAALAPLQQEPSRFFRFPYLAQSQLLRTNVVSGNMIVLDVDIDSNDWFRETPQQVLSRTLARLDARGQGVILFHDIHARTAEMLPAFLASLEERGFRVVTLRSRGSDVFTDVIVAGGDEI